MWEQFHTHTAALPWDTALFAKMNLTLGASFAAGGQFYSRFAQNCAVISAHY
jgi:hypothetical protein